MHMSGGNIVGAEYLVYVEDSDNDESGNMYILKDFNSDGSFNDEEPSDVQDNPFVIEENYIIMNLNFVMLDNPSNLALTWVTDQEDSNMNAAPTNNRVDGKVGIAGKLSKLTFEQIGVDVDYEGTLLTLNDDGYDVTSLPIHYGRLKVQL